MTYPILSGDELAKYSVSISKSYDNRAKSYRQNKYSVKGLLERALYISGEKYVTESMAKSVIRTYHIINPVANPERVGHLTAKFSNYLNELRGIGFPYYKEIGDFIDYIYGKAEEFAKAPYNVGTKKFVLSLLDMIEDIKPIYDNLSENLGMFKRILSYANGDGSADIRLTNTYENIADKFMEIRNKEELPRSVLSGKFMESLANVLKIINDNDGRPDSKSAARAMAYIDDAMFEAMMFSRKYNRYKSIRGQVERVILY